MMTMRLWRKWLSWAPSKRQVRVRVPAVAPFLFHAEAGLFVSLGAAVALMLGRQGVAGSNPVNVGPGRPAAAAPGDGASAARRRSESQGATSGVGGPTPRRATEGPRGCIVPLWDGDSAFGRSEGARGARTRGGRPLCLRVGRPSGGGPRAICTATMETPGCQLPRGTALLPQGMALRVIAPLDC